MIFHLILRHGLLPTAALALSQAFSPVSGAPPPPAEILVKCVGGPNSPAARDVDARLGGQTIRRFEAVGWHLVRLPAGADLAASMARYRVQPGVMAAEPNGPSIRRPPTLPPSEISETQAQDGLRPQATTPPRVIPNDPHFSTQASLKRIQLDQAWAITTGTTNVVVAVVDSGVDYTNPDLAENMWRNPGETGLDAQGRDKSTNGIDDDDNGYVDDVHGVDTIAGTGDPMDRGSYRSADGETTPYFHGTAVAGVIGAVGNNRLDLAGVCWKTQIMALAAMYGDESIADQPLLISHTLAAFDYILAMKRRGVPVRVVNNSYGWFRYSAALNDAFAALADEQVVLVFAAGNDPISYDDMIWDLSTSKLPNLVNVAATDPADALTTWSTYGLSTVHLAAPGQNISLLQKGGGISTGSGTSFSCPHVVGVVALLCSVAPDLTVDAIKAALFSSVDQRPSLKGKVRTGGRLNAVRALQSLTNDHPPAIVLFSQPAGNRTEPAAPIQMTFSRPMNRASVEASLRFDPPISGTVTWSVEGRTLTMSHPQPFANQRYTATLTAVALDADGASIDGNFNGTRETSPADDYVWTFNFRPPNDALEGATILTGSEGTVTGNNQRASDEHEDPSFVAGVLVDANLWYRWSPPTNGWYTFDLTQGTTFNTLLAAYRGTNATQLTELAANDNSTTRLQSRISFPAEAGDAYSILVGGNMTASVLAGLGSFNLHWYPTPPPTISFFSPTRALGGQVITLFGTNFSGTTTVRWKDIPLSFHYSTNASLLDQRLIVTLPALNPAEGIDGNFTVETFHGSAIAESALPLLPIPVLTLQPRPEGGYLLSWRDDALGFVLQASQRIGPGARWQTVVLLEAHPAVPGLAQRIESTINPERFFRLRQP